MMLKEKLLLGVSAGNAMLHKSNDMVFVAISFSYGCAEGGRWLISLGSC